MLQYICNEHTTLLIIIQIYAIRDLAVPYFVMFKILSSFSYIHPPTLTRTPFAPDLLIGTSTNLLVQAAPDIHQFILGH